MVLNHHSKPIEVGGDAPVSVQSMCTTLTSDVNATLQQIANTRDGGPRDCHDAGASTSIQLLREQFDHRGAMPVIEGLKAWLEREGVMWWSVEQLAGVVATGAMTSAGTAFSQAEADRHAVLDQLAIRLDRVGHYGDPVDDREHRGDERGVGGTIAGRLEVDTASWRLGNAAEDLLGVVLLLVLHEFEDVFGHFLDRLHKFRLVRIALLHALHEAIQVDVVGDCHDLFPPILLVCAR